MDMYAVMYYSDEDEYTQISYAYKTLKEAKEFLEKRKGLSEIFHEYDGYYSIWKREV